MRWRRKCQQKDGASLEIRQRSNEGFHCRATLLTAAGLRVNSECDTNEDPDVPCPQHTQRAQPLAFRPVCLHPSRHFNLIQFNPLPQALMSFHDYIGHVIKKIKIKTKIQQITLPGGRYFTLDLRSKAKKPWG